MPGIDCIIYANLPYSVANWLEFFCFLLFISHCCLCMYGIYFKHFCLCTFRSVVTQHAVLPALRIHGISSPASPLSLHLISPARGGGPPALL